MTAVLDVRQLSAGYRRSVVVRDINLVVEPGEVVALLGPNGAGKTSTLRAVSGLVRTFAGTVRLSGQDLSSATPTERARRGIAHVPEDRGLFFGLTVAEHFRLGRRGEHLDADLAYAYFPALADLSNRLAGVLSGGEQQMLAMGRALARKPDLLLLDELSLGLAPVMVERLLPVLREFADATSCGVLLVEQHVQLALGIADRAYLMAHGEISDSYDASELRRDRELIRASYLGGDQWEAGKTAAALSPRKRSEMKIAMIGAGRMGQALAGLFAEAGHDVLLSNSRGSESLAELVKELGPRCSAATVEDAVKASDVVFLATPWGKTADAVAAVSDWSGQIVVDTTNNRSAPGPQGLIDIGDRVSSEIVAEYVPGARVVKAFNTTPIPIMVAGLGAQAGENNAVFIAGDDADAKALVAGLVASIGGVAIDTGDLRTGGYLQGMSGPLAGGMEMLTPADARERLAQSAA